MGLYMSLNKIIVLLALTASMVSCIKEPVEETETPATAQEVYSAVAQGWGNTDPLTMAPNDFLFQETEQTIENNPKPFYVLQEGITISKKEEQTDSWLYTFLYQTKVYKQDQEGAQSTREDHRTVGKANAAVTMAQNALRAAKPYASLKTLAEDNQMSLGFERIYGLAGSCVKSDALDKYCKEDLGMDSCEIQCSNLKTADEVRPLPDMIKAQPNCGGFADCTYHVKTVQFNWTISLKKGESVETQKVNYSIALSPDMPFFSRMNEYCYRQLYTVQDQKVLVTTCTKLKNFKKGGT